LSARHRWPCDFPGDESCWGSPNKAWLTLMRDFPRPVIEEEERGLGQHGASAGLSYRLPYVHSSYTCIIVGSTKLPSRFDNFISAPASSVHYRYTHHSIAVTLYRGVLHACTVDGSRVVHVQLCTPHSLQQYSTRCTSDPTRDRGRDGPVAPGQLRRRPPLRQRHVLARRCVALQPSRFGWPLRKLCL
jgi:hypothetical protein